MHKTNISSFKNRVGQSPLYIPHQPTKSFHPKISPKNHIQKKTKIQKILIKFVIISPAALFNIILLHTFFSYNISIHQESTSTGIHHIFNDLSKTHKQSVQLDKITQNRLTTVLKVFYLS